MLTITPRALAVIRRVSLDPAPRPTSGLRISRRPDASRPCEVRAVGAPLPGDEVIERDGARLILDSDVAASVDDKELDAATDTQGRVQFVMRAGS